ncbi:AAA family ATPase [Anaerococcus sp. AGMB00486]|uniref:AAA family ATPase n=2 Tax=Anaerococcus TaxID=165779 RepID=A0ABX2N9E8_9FIRM|nr:MULTISPECIES: AAA family ATPase [Anaerococcus]MDY3005755.1 AAA family ATPase [Anaerococcus porci]MSS77474.1 AAA family ATPase [Anaerococcus porci]NVF11142.1 AAA family ATPase [Anaerococcus faecalis]
MARYLVGDSIDTWNFTDAYNSCNDNDIIELEKNFELYLPNGFILNKNITIEGHLENKNNTDYYTNNIYGDFTIKNKSNVLLKSLWIECINNTKNILNIKDSSVVSLNNVVLKRSENIKINSNEGKYPDIYLDVNSKLFMDSVTTFDIEDNYSVFFFKNSRVEIKNSNINSNLTVNNSTVNIENTSISKHYTNTINCQNSTLSIKNSSVKGGFVEKDLPSLYLKNSKLYSNNSIYEQNKYTANIYLSDNSYIESSNDTISSLNLSESRGLIENTTIKEIIFIIKKSYLVSDKNLLLLGKNNEKIDIYMDDFSTLRAKIVDFYRVFNPNVRLNGNSYLQINNINYEGEFDLEKINSLKFETKQDSTYKILSLDNPDSKNDSNGLENSNEESNNEVDAFSELNKLIGLSSVKNEINKMVRMVEFNKKRMEQGLPVEKSSLHSVFLGNPGTGKTTVARLIGKILFENGALYNKDKYIFIEASESDLISSFVGKTAIQTHEILEKAKGGVLFIDEAYTLNKGDSSVNHGQEAINTILKYMEDHRDEIMIIFAGYTKEMEQFLETNPGLKSRVSNRFIFEDYTSDEIVEIGESILISKQYVLEDRQYYKKNVSFAYESTLDKSNARWIRNFNEKLLKVFADRVIETGSDDFTTITNTDIDEVFDSKKYKNYDDKDEDAYEKLNKLIGINQVKKQVNEFISMAELNKRRKDQGQRVQSMSLHSLFLGNPGTGKTTVARILGSLLYQKSIITENKFIEVSRSDLVAGFVGQTAIKTREVLKSALGGVLFIDEAYSLSSGTGNDFGREAIDEILKFMEDYRDNIVIIFAGYSKEMAEFLGMNSGLSSRIPNRFVFEDYDDEEICQIGLLSLNSLGYNINEDLYKDIIVNNYHKTNDNSNGRWVRNFNERLVKTMSQRVANTNSDDIDNILDEDLLNIKE